MPKPALLSMVLNSARLPSTMSSNLAATPSISPRDFVVRLVFVVCRLVIAQIDVENQTAKLSSQAIAVIHGIRPAGAGIRNHQFLLDFEHLVFQRFGGLDDARR